MHSREIHEEANARTRRGIGLLEKGDRDSLGEALGEFDRAIKLRRGLPLDEDPLFRWGLAAGWMNRGDVLRRQGKAAESVVSYDEALAVLEGLEDHPAVRNRRALAWNGRGLASGRLEDFSKAIEVIGEPVDRDQSLTLAAARLHRSEVAPARDEVLADAMGALEGVNDIEFTVEAAAEIALKARHRICRCWCEWLESPGTSTKPVDDWIAATTDRVEEALALERAWERTGVRSMRAVACDLFRLGLKVYGTCQPHFLAEFLLDSLDPERSPGAPADDPGFQAAAVKALKETMAVVAFRGTSHVDDEVARQLDLLEGLRVADRRLAVLQRKSSGD